MVEETPHEYTAVSPETIAHSQELPVQVDTGIEGLDPVNEQPVLVDQSTQAPHTVEQFAQAPLPQLEENQKLVDLPEVKSEPAPNMFKTMFGAQRPEEVVNVNDEDELTELAMAQVGHHSNPAEHPVQ